RPESLARLTPHPVHRTGVVTDQPAGGPQAAVQSTGQGSLSRTRRADHPHRRIAWGDGHRNTLQDFVTGVATPEIMGLKNGSCGHAVATPSAWVRFGAC